MDLLHSKSYGFLLFSSLSQHTTIRKSVARISLIFSCKLGLVWLSDYICMFYFSILMFSVFGSVSIKFPIKQEITNLCLGVLDRFCISLVSTPPPEPLWSIFWSWIMYLSVFSQKYLLQFYRWPYFFTLKPFCILGLICGYFFTSFVALFIYNTMDLITFGVHASILWDFSRVCFTSLLWVSLVSYPDFHPQGRLVQPCCNPYSPLSDTFLFLYVSWFSK